MKPTQGLVGTTVRISAFEGRYRHTLLSMQRNSVSQKSRIYLFI